jgi:hypothetical protein
MTRTPTSALGWCIALPLLALAGPVAAGPETCLTLRDNAAVAQCANHYGPAQLPTYPRERTPTASAGTRYAAARPEDVLQAVPVPTQKSAVAPSVEPKPTFANPEHYAFILNGMAISGIAGFVVLGVVGWMWRLKGASAKRCPFCSARVAANAHVCKSCFRVI